MKESLSPSPSPLSPVPLSPSLSSSLSPSPSCLPFPLFLSLSGPWHTLLSELEAFELLGVLDLILVTGLGLFYLL